MSPTPSRHCVVTIVAGAERNLGKGSRYRRYASPPGHFDRLRSSRPNGSTISTVARFTLVQQVCSRVASPAIAGSPPKAPTRWSPISRGDDAAATARLKLLGHPTGELVTPTRTPSLRLRPAEILLLLLTPEAGKPDPDQACKGPATLRCLACSTSHRPGGDSGQTVTYYYKPAHHVHAAMTRRGAPA